MSEASGGGWFMGEGDRRVGPMDLGELRARLGDGKHGPGTLVWREGMADWARAEDVAEVRDAVGVGGSGADGMGSVSPPAMPGGGVGGGAGVAPRSRDQTSNLFAVLSYVSLIASVVVGVAWVFAVVALILKRDAYSLYHAKQAVTLLIVSFVAYLVCVPLIVVFFVGIPLMIAVVIGSLVLAIIGTVNASRGEMKPLPLVGGWAEAWWSGLQSEV